MLERTRNPSKPRTNWLSSKFWGTNLWRRAADSTHQVNSMQTSTLSANNNMKREDSHWVHEKDSNLFICHLYRYMFESPWYRFHIFLRLVLGKEPARCLHSVYLRTVLVSLTEMTLFPPFGELRWTPTSTGNHNGSSGFHIGWRWLQLHLSERHFWPPHQHFSWRPIAERQKTVQTILWRRQEKLTSTSKKVAVVTNVKTPSPANHYPWWKLHIHMYRLIDTWTNRHTHTHT